MHFIKSVLAAGIAIYTSGVVANDEGSINIHYCQDHSDCHVQRVRSFTCERLDSPGLLDSIQNTADCSLYRFPVCHGPHHSVPRGANLITPPFFTTAIFCEQPGIWENDY